MLCSLRAGRASGAIPALVAALVVVAPVAGQESRPVRLADAAEQGTFNVGAAQAAVERVVDPALGADVLKLSYTLPPGTAAGLWAKAFPSLLDASTADILRLGLKGQTDPARPVEAALEVKGSSGIQRIPLEVRPEWAHVEEPIDWAAVGSLNEVVVLVSRVGEGPPATGTVAIDVRFERLTTARKLAMSPLARLGGVLVLSLLGALGVVLLRALFSVDDQGGETGTGTARRRPEPVPVSPPGSLAPPGTWPEPRGAEGLRRDFVLGAGVVLAIVLALEVYLLGGRGPLEAGWAALWLALAGAALAEWFKYGLTGTHLTARETFRDFLFTGMLAASASRLDILAAPVAWSDLLLLNRLLVATVVLIYHVANARRLATTRQHLGGVTGALIVGAPYLLSGMPLLRSDALLEGLGGALTLGTLTLQPAVREFVGRVLVLFVINELVANALGLVTRRTAVRSVRFHLALLGVALGAVAAPWIAAIGSGATVAAWPTLPRLGATLLTTMVSQAGLWGEVYLLTGLAMDALHGRAPSPSSAISNPYQGMRKAVVYSGTFMGIVYGLGLLLGVPELVRLAAAYPVVCAALFGALVFPLIKTIIETFDGSRAFFRRIGRSYRNPLLYLRGAIAGAGLGVAVSLALEEQATSTRMLFGLVFGVLAYAGVDLLRDLVESARGRGRARPRPARVYISQALLGGFIGAALGFYFDASQVSIIAAKFDRYLAAGQSPEPFGVYPLLSKWGFLDLGEVTGGVGLLFAEALAGVISWSIPAWLFALNRTFMTAYFRKDPAPIRAMFSGAGLRQVTQNMIEVLRWGLWMSPIINSFLRPMGTPTWYNQDGAIRTLWAIANDLTMSPEAFRAWSLQVFIYLLAYDAVRILIWLDHMGLRVATLVNLSFLGMDRLDARLSRWLAPEATARFIPEGVKRFTTWAPLLVPYYIPRGADWDRAWNESQAIMATQGAGPLAALVALPLTEKTLLLVGAIVAGTAVSAALRRLAGRAGQRTLTLRNAAYEVTLRDDGAITSHVLGRGYDVTRRSYDGLDPAGRALFLVEETGAAPRVWPVVGNVPEATGSGRTYRQTEQSLILAAETDDLRTTVSIELPNIDDPVELWTVTITNSGDSSRLIRVVPYLEWVLNRPEADRGHTQYNRLFAELEYSAALHAVLARDKHSRALGLLAADIAPEGFLTSRIDFIGRARSLGSPRVLETLAFSEARTTEAHPTLDPIGSLLLSVSVPARGTVRLRLLMGMAEDRAQAIELIARHLEVPGAAAVAPVHQRATLHPIGHGEIPPGTPRPYSEFSEDGRTLLVHTPFTPRPVDHPLSNALGQIASLTNRGFHTTASVNAQQNRLTPDWPDIVTREVPGEAFYLYDPETGAWFSPTYHPLNDPTARHEVAFSVDGTATYRMEKQEIETELTVFVPPDVPASVYLLTVRNRSGSLRGLRLAPYFQMVLADQPENSGPLRVRHDEPLSALFFENPRNSYRTGPAFVAISGEIEWAETQRGRFFGGGRDVAHPALVERGRPDDAALDDDRPVAALLTALELPAQGEQTVVVLLGQADSREQAEAVIRAYRDLDTARAGLGATRRWWTDLMETVRVRTGSVEFDRLLDWLKYQALAERIWSRRGFYQASGAFGFRDQLQDAVNLIWVDPALAWAQIRLHAAQQFPEGDVVHWFHRLQDGRTGFAARTHASDNLLWLGWAVAEYVRMTGDESILDERTAYLEAEQPFEPLPAGKHGMGFDPLRSARQDSVYRHVLKAIDLVLEQRMGAHGLPLIGTGDWNDGLDEIGSQGRGESVWLGLFLAYILGHLADLIGRRDGPDRRAYYLERLAALKEALEGTWRGDRYLRAIHDDGTEIGIEGSGVWEIDALTAAWAVLADVNPQRAETAFETAVRLLERETTILLGWPPLREDTHPYLGRSSGYPEGVRENGMYCHGVQWLVGAARVLAERCRQAGRAEEARRYQETAYRLWLKVSPIPHVIGPEIETYGGQPNKQAADMVTTFDPGRMIWHGYTGAAGWMLRQALEGVLGLRLEAGELIAPADPDANGGLGLVRVSRDTSSSPLPGPAELRRPAQSVDVETSKHPS